MRIEALKRLKVKRISGDIVLTPGTPVEFSDEEALTLLAKAPGKVRLVAASDSVTIEPAHSEARPVFWEKADGSIVGPAKPEFLARVGSGPHESYCVVATFEGLPVWIRSDFLRSKKQFEHQPKVRTVEFIKEPR